MGTDTLFAVLPPDGVSETPHLRWASDPELRAPVIVCAFEGWNDAGEAASTAARYLRDRWEAETLAEFDAEEFYDFTMTRPLVQLDDEGQRSIEWPETTFSFARIPDTETDIIVLLGVEPQLRWRSFCDHIVQLAEAVDSKLIVTLGALLAEVPHRRDTPVYGRTNDPVVADELDLDVSTYEGPTGIVGVLHRACQDAGLNAASLWAAVPSYVSGATSPKAALALLDRLTHLLRVPLDTTGLQIMAVDYERQVDELVTEDPDTAEYVTQLEAHFDEMSESGDGQLVDEIEAFLRNQHPTDPPKG